VTISDYLAYCVLPQDEIDNMVFGHRDPFKNIKRRYVFQIVYGLYDVQMAALQEELRDVLAEIRQIKSQTSAFERFLTNTPWENRAALAREREDTRRELTSLESQVVESAERAAISDRALDLRRQIAGLERDRASAASEQEFERQSIDQLTRLLGQLEGQSSRLTRAIVAGELLVDFEFRICPRCGTPIELQRASEQVCPLCLQTPNPSAVDRDVLVGEQDRLGLQIQETRELIAEHHVALREIDSRLTALNRTRIAIAEELDYQTRAYVSDAASALTHAAEKRAELESTITRLEDYEKLFFKLDEALSDLLTLDSRRGEIEAALEVAKSRQFSAEGRIGRLEDEMERALEAFEAPRFADPPTSAVNRQNFLPVVDGRSFDELSSQGLQVLVNVAHALAHQQTAFGLGLMLPNILFIDGLTSNIGHEGLDLERVNHVYDYLIALSQSLGNEIQIIVADNDVPVQAHSYVRVRFDESERLIRRAS